MSSIDDVIALVLKEAENCRTIVDYSGRWDDGGASLLKTQVEYFNYGRSGQLPPAWAKFAQQASNEADPEYVKYLELKKKLR